MKVPSIAELYRVIRAIKETVTDYDRAHEDDEIPGVCLTVGVNSDGEWAVQVGCNEYHGSAYFYPHWVVRDIYRSTNCRVLAREVREEIREILSAAE